MQTVLQKNEHSNMHSNHPMKVINRNMFKYINKMKSGILRIGNQKEKKPPNSETDQICVYQKWEVG